jgi:hypothetical protein
VGRLPDSRSLDMPVRDRAKEIWKPLVRIAEAAGGDWPKEAREAAVFFTDANATREANTDGIELLAHIKEAFLEADKIWTSTLLQRLNEREESPWRDVKGKPLSDRGLAERLRGYGIRSRDVKIDGTNRKGFLKSDFEDAWKRYLHPVNGFSATSATNLTNNNNLVAAVAPISLGRLPDLEDCMTAEDVAEKLAEFDYLAERLESLQSRKKHETKAQRG